MDRQTSTTHIVESNGTGAVGDDDRPPVAEVASTAIPFREEFRARRLWFFYHDIRALTTSWVPLPLFTIYRVVLFCYIFAWLISHGVIRSDEFGARWFIFITDISYLILVIGLGVVTILCVVYTVIHYLSPDKLQKGFPKVAASQQLIYSQDNIPLYAKISWLLYIVGASTTLMVAIGYWAVVYDCPDSDSSAATTSASNTSNDSATVAPAVDCIDYATIQFHGIAAILMIIDLYLSRIPFQLLHFFYPCITTVLYVIFTGIYHGAGGTNHEGDSFIYSVLDYEDKPGTSAVLAIVLVFLPIVFFLILFLLARLRDLLYQKVGFCFRDFGHFNQKIANGDTKYEAANVTKM